jgi:hypothetical protein
MARDVFRADRDGSCRRRCVIEFLGMPVISAISTSVDPPARISLFASE